MKLSSFKMGAIYPMASDYMAGNPNAVSFFPTNWSDQKSILERSTYLAKRNYPRLEVAEHIEKYMNRFGLSDVSLRNIQLLKENALVVIGGQQAGLLTGPLYAINKIISVIKLAEKQSSLLGVPVIPVFWIAGEDHDYAEVNHVYIKDEKDLIKKTYPYKPKTKEMISDMILDFETAKKWIEEVVEVLGETNRTKDLVAWLTDTLRKTKTISDFFAMLVNELFKDKGLLLVDSGNQEFRKLGVSAYGGIVKQCSNITAKVLEQQQKIRQSGYMPMLEMEMDNANLFFYDYHDKNRSLLSFHENKNRFVSKNNLHFTTEELLERVEIATENFSTNVVTRPMLQEKLFPVLAFVGGPGEIIYWAEIGDAFELVGEKMPPVFPRLNITLLERNIESYMNELHLPLEQVVKNGCSKEKQVVLESLKDRSIDEAYEVLTNMIDRQHDLWSQNAIPYDSSLESLFKKNKAILYKQLEFMKKKTEESHLRSHEELVRKFNDIENSVHPLGGPQDRVLNPIYFMNKYGKDWLEFLLKSDFEFGEWHYVLSI
ncbi:MAG: bshC [Bacillales bacterium]|jgi:bacillithiol biosynthesis cysteine-adding enzyme BshC|nr:bshC [Bacillales bacterium]